MRKAEGGITTSARCCNKTTKVTKHTKEVMQITLPTNRSLFFTFVPSVFFVVKVNPLDALLPIL
jgi:hypothetical protein